MEKKQLDHGQLELRSNRPLLDKGSDNFDFFPTLNKLTGETPMNLAAQSGQLNVIEHYLNKLPGDKNPKRMSNDDIQDHTPLHSAASFGHLKIVEAISEKILDKNPRDIHGLTPLHYAAANGSLPSHSIVSPNYSKFN